MKYEINLAFILTTIWVFVINLGVMFAVYKATTIDECFPHSALIFIWLWMAAILTCSGIIWGLLLSEIIDSRYR